MGMNRMARRWQSSHRAGERDRDTARGGWRKRCNHMLIDITAALPADNHEYWDVVLFVCVCVCFFSFSLVQLDKVIRLWGLVLTGAADSSPPCRHGRGQSRQHSQTVDFTWMCQSNRGCKIKIEWRMRHAERNHQCSFAWRGNKHVALCSEQ